MMNLTPYIAHLKDLPFVESVTLSGWDLFVTTCDSAVHKVDIQVVSGTLSTPRLSTVRLSPPGGSEYSLVVASRITRSAAQALRHFALKDKARIWYMDLGGNHFIYVGRQYLSSVDGQPVPEIDATERDIRSAGYRALFALMVDINLVNLSERDIAARAGVSRSAAATMARRLQEEGHVIEGSNGKKLIRSPELLEKWIVGYDAILRPRLLLATYAMPEGGVSALEKRLQHFSRDNLRWAWGGHPAARRLGGDYPGLTATVHIEGLRKNAPLVLPLKTAPDGLVVALGLPGPLALAPESDVVHPLLVVAELMRERDPRSITMARELIERHQLAGRKS